MEQYIPKSAVLAEINKRLHQLTDAAFDSMIGRNLIEIRDSLDTLEIKEVDLEEDINDFINEEYHYTEYDGKWVDEKDWRDSIQRCSKHFFELGIQSQLSWQDIRRISEIGEDFMNSDESDNLSEEEYYTAILDKLKEGDYKTSRQEIRDLVQKGE